jgi:hypothetical protein
MDFKINPKTATRPTQTWAEIVAPIHEDFIRSGETPEEATAFIEKEIKAYRAEKREEERRKQISSKL